MADYFKVGLNVSLSTDNPLQIHITSEPLLEEYSVAQKYWKLSMIDLCEIARNSVLQSGFTRAQKQRWLGVNFDKPGSEGNDVGKTNVPDVRVQFRSNRLQYELGLLRRIDKYLGSLYVRDSTSAP